jgi:3-octaprenyl-4-hydroxybenzoate carboxy-lyase Rift-related domain
MCLSAPGAAAAGTLWPSSPLASASRPCSSAWDSAIRSPPRIVPISAAIRRASANPPIGSRQPALPRRACPSAHPRAPDPVASHRLHFIRTDPTVLVLALVPLSRPAGHHQPASPALLIPTRRKPSPPAGQAQSTPPGRWNAYPLCIWTRGEDPAPYVTGPCVISKDPETGERNMGTYRLMPQGPRRLGLLLSRGATCTRTS